MPNQIDASGLQVATRAELVAQLTSDLQSIYGADINLASDSPDGQWMNIIVQLVLDMEDLLVQIYNGFDPDLAIGRVLDQRVAINGVQREGGTYTMQNITVVITNACTLQGLDTFPNAPFTVADSQGVQYYLENTIALVAGVYSLVFRAAAPGAVQSAVNDITVPVTIVPGVGSVNNPTTYSSLGVNEESDADLRLRRQRSVSLATQGYLTGLLAALKNLSGMVNAYVYENVTDATDSNGIPAHSIWCVVSGTSSNADIADAIYRKRNAGCGLKGSVVQVITQVDGSPFAVKWDVVTNQDLYIAMQVTSLDGVNAPNVAAIRAQLPSLCQQAIASQQVSSQQAATEVNINQLATLVQQIDPNALVLIPNNNFGFSYDGTAASYLNKLTPSALNFQFLVYGTEPKLHIVVV